MSDESRGWVYLEKDWDGGRLHLDLVEQAGLLGGSFSLLDISQRAGLGGYAKDGQEALFLIEENLERIDEASCACCIIFSISIDATVCILGAGK